MAASPVQPVPGMAGRAGLEEQGGEQALRRGHRGSRQELGSGCPRPGVGCRETASPTLTHAAPVHSPVRGVAGGPMPSSAAVRTSLRLAARCHLQGCRCAWHRQLDKRPRGGRPSNVPTCAAAQTAICRAVRLPGGKPDGEPWSEHPGELWLRGGGGLRRDDGPSAHAPARSPRTLGGVGGPQCADIACALVAGLVAAGGNREPAA